MRKFLSMAALTAICIALLVGAPTHAQKQSARAQIEDPPLKALDETYQQIWQHVTESYTAKLPPDWDNYRQRFAGKLKSADGLRGAVETALSSVDDRRLRVLTRDQIEEYQCRLESGFVGLGIRFKSLNLVNEGLLIKTVVDGTTASDAGLTTGTVITSVDGVSMKGMRWENAEALFAGEEASLMKLALLKDGQKSEVTTKRNPGKTLGLEVELSKPTCLFEIDWVMWESPAQKAGIKERDIVTHINGNNVEGGSSAWMMNQSATGPLGTVISLTLERDGKPFTVEMKRSIVETWDKSFGMSTQSSDGPGGKGLSHLTLKNLDWNKVVNWVDDHADDMNTYPGCILDLRGASGDDPELAARIAARFIENGQVLSYAGSQQSRVRYVVAQTDEGNCTLLVIRLQAVNPTLKAVERRIRQVLDTKLVVLVDDRTSGTAEALALALQQSGRATVVGSTTAGVNQLVSTRIFTGGDHQLYLQAPTLTLLAQDNQPISSISPDRKVWWGNPLDTAKDALSGRHWYNDPGYLCVGSMLGILALLMGITSWVSRRNRRSDETQLMVLTGPKEPMTFWQRSFTVVMILALLGTLFTVGLLSKRARETAPEGATAQLIAELHLNPETHQKHEEMFRQLAKEIDGPITFIVVPDAAAKNWIYPGITVKYQWVDKEGNNISSGSRSLGAENKLQMVKALEMVQTNLGYQYPQSKPQLITWHRQTPVLR